MIATVLRWLVALVWGRLPNGWDGDVWDRDW